MSHREAAIKNLAIQLGDQLLTPSQPGFDHATTVWARSPARPRAVVKALTTADVQVAVNSARDAGLPLSVRAGGHDWAGRALCDGVVIDLTGMRDVTVSVDGLSARVGGGTLARDLAERTDPLGLAAVAGQIGAVGLGGLTLGGGYGPLISLHGLACDNLVAADVVLSNGRLVTAGQADHRELLWALRGGGGNFGVVTSMTLRLHRIPSIYTGMIFYPLADAASVLEQAAAFCRSAPDELNVQLAIVSSPEGDPVVAAVPTWCGDPASSETQVAPLTSLGKPLHVDLKQSSFGEALAMFDGPMTGTHYVYMGTCWVPDLTAEVCERLAAHAAQRPGPGCSIITHEFRGAASRLPSDAGAFGMRDTHTMLEFVAQYDDGDGSAERAWADSIVDDLAPFSLAGAYPNLLASGDPRAMFAYGANATRLAAVKQRYDPVGLFRSALAIPL